MKNLIKTNTDIEKHDKGVLNKWKKLQKSSKEMSGPILSRYEHLRDAKEIAKLTNAAGLLQHSLGVNSETEQQPHKVGPFESIVKSYCDKKKCKNKSNTKMNDKTDEVKYEHLKMLASLKQKLTDKESWCKILVILFC